MTFVAPASSTAAPGRIGRLFNPVNRGRLPIARSRAADEDSARRALGFDSVVPPTVGTGADLESLARIALG